MNLQGLPTKNNKDFLFIMYLAKTVHTNMSIILRLGEPSVAQGPIDLLLPSSSQHLSF